MNVDLFNSYESLEKGMNPEFGYYNLLIVSTLWEGVANNRKHVAVDIIKKYRECTPKDGQHKVILFVFREYFDEYPDDIRKIRDEVIDKEIYADEQLLITIAQLFGSRNTPEI